MKTYFRNFGKAIPLAIGLVLTIISARLAMSGQNDDSFSALVTGLVGIPMAVASLIAFAPQERS